MPRHTFLSSGAKRLTWGTASSATFSDGHSFPSNPLARPLTRRALTRSLTRFQFAILILQGQIRLLAFS